MKINKAYIYAADEDFDDLLEEEDGLEDTLDSMADDIEDMQENFEEIEEDDPSIEVDNNISGHYIAECDRCHEIFISAVIESEQEVDTIKGICPICGKHSEQFLKWIIKDVE